MNATTTSSVIEFHRAVERELERAEQLSHGDFNSLHEAYAVLLEEVDEFWDEVKKKSEKRSPVAIFDELVQVAAMAAKASRLLKTTW